MVGREIQFFPSLKEQKQLKISDKRILNLCGGYTHSIDGPRLKAFTPFLRKNDVILIYPNEKDPKAYQSWEGAVSDEMNFIREKGVLILEVNDWREKNKKIWEDTKTVVDNYLGMTENTDINHRKKIDLLIKELEKCAAAFHSRQRVEGGSAEDDRTYIKNEAIDALVLVYIAKQQKEVTLIVHLEQFDSGFMGSLLYRNHLGKEYDTQYGSYFYMRPERFQIPKPFLGSTQQINQELENDPLKQQNVEPKLNLNTFTKRVANIILTYELSDKQAALFMLALLSVEEEKAQKSSYSFQQSKVQMTTHPSSPHSSSNFKLHSSTGAKKTGLPSSSVFSERTIIKSISFESSSPSPSSVTKN